MIEQPIGACPAQLGSLLQSVPLAPQPHLEGLHIAPAHLDASATTTITSSIRSDTKEDAQQQLRQGMLMAIILKPLGRDAEMERGGVAFLHVRVRLAQKVDKGLFQRRRLVEALPRATPHPCVDEGG